MADANPTKIDGSNEPKAKAPKPSKASESPKPSEDNAADAVSNEVAEDSTKTPEGHTVEKVNGFTIIKR